jgi:hypothetical protein
LEAGRRASKEWTAVRRLIPPQVRPMCCQLQRSDLCASRQSAELARVQLPCRLPSRCPLTPTEHAPAAASGLAPSSISPSPLQACSSGNCNGPRSRGGSSAATKERRRPGMGGRTQGRKRAVSGAEGRTKEGTLPVGRARERQRNGIRSKRFAVQFGLTAGCVQARRRACHWAHQSASLIGCFDDQSSLPLSVRARAPLSFPSFVTADAR